MPCASATGKGMSRRVVTVVLLLNWALFIPVPGQAIPGFFTSERGAGPGHALARLTSRVLFNNNRSQEGAPILAYGYLSHVDGLSVASKKVEDESSAALTIVVAAGKHSLLHCRNIRRRFLTLVRFSSGVSVQSTPHPGPF